MKKSLKLKVKSFGFEREFIQHFLSLGFKLTRSGLGKSAGFTLIELLAVLVILVSVGSMVVLIMVNSFRGTTTSGINNKIRDDGNFAVNRISRDIQFAQAFVGVKKTDQDAFDKSVCGSLTDTTPTPLAKFKYIKILNEDRDEIIYACRPDNQGILSLRRENSAGSSMLIDESQLRIKGEECYFTCSQNFLTDPPTIGISFMLEDINGSASIQFKTSVTMRNVNK